MSEEAEPTVVQVTVGAPIERVWESLRDPDLIRLWHGWHYDDLDAEINVIFLKDADANEAAHTLQLSDGDRFELEAAEGGTVVRVVRAPYVPDTEWSQYYHEITEGWLSFLQQLRFMHELHPGETRRTLFLTGSGAQGAVDELLESVPATVGAAHYTAEHQRGLALPDLGPGLLVVAAKPPVAGDQGEVTADAMAIITTYGLDDEAFASEVEKWTAWWRSAYPEAAPAQV